MESVLKTSTTIAACGSIAVYIYVMYKKWKLDEYGREIKEATNNFGTAIGSGPRGITYYGVLKNGDRIAVKVYNRTVQPEKEVARLKDVQKKLNRRNTIVGALIIHEKLCLVSRYAEHGNLATNLKNPTARQCLTWRIRIRIIQSITSVLGSLHDRHPPLVHSNLKPTNVLLNNHWVATIADCGLYDPCNDAEPSIYTDPIYLRTGVASIQGDLYTFGIMILELMTGRVAGHKLFDGETIIDWVSCRAPLDSPRYQEILDPILLNHHRTPQEFIKLAQPFIELALGLCGRQEARRSKFWHLRQEIKKARENGDW